MSQPGSEASHDAKVVALLGAAAVDVAAAPVAYPQLDDLERIEAALGAGKTCRIQARGARLLIYRFREQVNAVATELAHAGYRRRYRTYQASTVADLVDQVRAAYGGDD